MSEDNNTPNTETTPATPNNPPTPPATPANPAQGRVWTDEYVQGLREEAKTNRLAKKNYETKLRTLLGLKEDEDIDDAKITSYQARTQQDIATAISKANDRLIQAEIKVLEGYDVKLVSKLLDKSEVKIADDGTVTGIKEALVKLEAEFPQVKISTPGNPANPAGGGSKTELQKLEEEYNEARKVGNMALTVSLKNKIFAMQNK